MHYIYYTIQYVYTGTVTKGKTKKLDSKFYRIKAIIMHDKNIVIMLSYRRYRLPTTARFILGYAFCGFASASGENGALRTQTKNAKVICLFR